MKLHVVDESQRPRVHGGPIADFLGRLGFRARAWTRGGDVYLARSARSSPNVLGLVAHEVEHVERPFDHHAHLCGKSVPVVGTRHLSRESLERAADLLRDA